MKVVCIESSVEWFKVGEVYTACRSGKSRIMIRDGSDDGFDDWIAIKHPFGWYSKTCGALFMEAMCLSIDAG